MEVFTTWSGGASSSRWLGSTLLEQNYQFASESPASTAVQSRDLCGDEFRR